MEHHEHRVHDEFFCLCHASIAQVILEVTQDSQVTGTCFGHVQTWNSQKTWVRDTEQPVICARLKYCLCDHNQKN